MFSRTLSLCCIGLASFLTPATSSAAPTDAYLVFGQASDGGTDYLEVSPASHLDLTGGAFSMSAWIAPSGWGQNNQGRILDHGGGSGPPSGWSLHLDDNQLTRTLRVQLNNDSSFVGVADPNSITLGTWQHVAVTLQAGTLTIYVDGAVVGVHTGAPTPNASSAPMRVGVRATDTNRGFDGLIDDVRIWDRALSQQEIQNSMESDLVGNEAGLVAYYRLDDGSGQEATDDSPAARHARLGSTPNADANDPFWAVAGDETQDWPTLGWATSTPAEMNMDEALLDDAVSFAGGSGMITRSGRLVRSWGNLSTLYDLKSTTKSIGGSALGLAIGDGLLDVDDAANSHLPSIGVPPAANTATGWTSQISLLHLATHTAGFEVPGGFGDLLFQPGTAWSYTDGGANWLADILTVTYGDDLSDVLFSRVFDFLGIESGDLVWRQNIYRGTTINGIERRELGSGINANVDAMARIGLLYLRDGQWEGQTILPESFVTMASRPIAGVAGLPEIDPANHPNSSDHYGLLWWNNADGSMPNVPLDAYWSWGLRESLIVVIPSLDVVASRAGSGWRPGWNSNYSVIEPFIGAIAQSVTPSPPPPSNRCGVAGEASLVLLAAFVLRARRATRG